MDVARPASRLTCPRCGTLQESPGSTVCEECGADLLRSERPPAASSPSIDRGAAARRAGDAVTAGLRAAAAVPVRLVRGIVAAVTALLYFILRIVTVTLRIILIVLVVGALIVGLSYIPAVQAKLPAAKQLPGRTFDLLQEGAQLGSRFVRSLWTKTPPPLEASRPAAAPRPQSASKPAPAASKPAPAKAAAKPAAAAPPAVPSLTVKSSPQGATVLLNQRRVGRTPLTIKLAPGTYKVTVSRSGYKSVVQTVTVRTNAPASINVTLIMAP